MTIHRKYSIYKTGELFLYKYISRKIYFILILMLIPKILFSQSVNVPLNHWAYNFLDRMETRGLFRSLLLRARPISRDDLATILVQIEKNSTQQNIKLSKSEQDLLEQLKGEFHEEIKKFSINTNKRFHERHLLKWSENNNQFNIDLDFKQHFEINRGEQFDSTKRTSNTTAGVIIRGNLKKSLAFYLHFKNTLVKGENIERENFNPDQGLPVVISGENAFKDDAFAYFIWKLPWFKLELGRDQAQWGPGYQGSLMLSRFNPLFDMLKIRAEFKRFYFTSIHGKLNSSHGTKYLAAHRLEFQAFPWLYLAGSESVIYGNRDVELQYLNPIMPYHVAEHHLGDRDNNTMAFELTMFPYSGHKLFCELFLDDFTSSENPFTYFGNKFAFLAGHFWANPLGISNTGFRTEYTRIEPFVYTHHVPINVYQNYNQNIGHWLKPNSDQLYFELSSLINRDLNIKFLAERIRHGEGDVNTPHTKQDGLKKLFLSGVVETRWRFGIDITDQIMRDFFLTLQYNFFDTKNLNQIAGENSNDNQIIFQLTANW